jgi:hypothetical protein
VCAIVYQEIDSTLCDVGFEEINGTGRLSGTAIMRLLSIMRKAGATRILLYCISYVKISYVKDE